MTPGGDAETYTAMGKTLEFYFDFGSPPTYLAHTQMPGLARRTGATVIYRPMLLGGVFKATGNQSPVMIPAKGKHLMEVDMWRFARRYDVPLRVPPGFPINTMHLMRGAIVAQEDGCFETYADAVFDAMWVEGRDLADAEVFAAALTEAGLDAANFARRLTDRSIKDRLKALTEEAVARGVFGAPTFFVGSEMFWGQDRLDFVEQAVTA